MDFTQLQDFVIVLMAICALLAGISGACAAVVKFWRYAHKQSDENAAALKEIESYLANDKDRIEALEERQVESDAQAKLQLRALVTLLGHEIDGNHTKQLIEVRDEIQEYLIGK